MKKLTRKTTAALILLLIALGFLFSVIFNFTAKDSAGSAIEYRLEVPAGSTIGRVSKDLKSKGIIRSATVFYGAARCSSFILKSGSYTVNSSMNVFDILELLNSGKQEYIRTVIPEGITKSKIGAILEKDGVCTKQDFLNAVYDVELIKSYGIEADNLEGFLFPDTYFFSAGQTGKATVKIMVDNFFKQVKDIEEIKDMPMNEFYNVLILASIVECEYLQNKEAPLVASVFSNRLKRNIGLESCATINYIREEILGLDHVTSLTTEDTKINSPYNTYKWAGLVPGPISNPGITAIKAAANPPKTSYYYFCSKEDGSGEHVFSSTLEEHNEAKYKMKQTKRKTGAK